MDRYHSCMPHPSSEGSLLIGDTFAAMLDCGMAFCAGETVRRVKAALKGRPLDYLFVSHTHYDHIGALPRFRKEWPGLRVAASEAGAAVLLKDTPRRVIRELSLAAATAYNTPLDAGYSDDAFMADIIVKGGDRVDLGGLTVEVLETPGHTRDSLSFFIPEPALLITNESLGVLMPDGSVHPCYLTSYADAVRSIEACGRMPRQFLSLPHRGVVGGEDAAGFFHKALAANKACRDFIVESHESGRDEAAILEAFERQFRGELLARYQPREAFLANARATISCTLRDEARQVHTGREGAGDEA